MRIALAALVVLVAAALGFVAGRSNAAEASEAQRIARASEDAAFRRSMDSSLPSAREKGERAGLRRGRGQGRRRGAEVGRREGEAAAQETTAQEAQSQATEQEATTASRGAGSGASEQAPTPSEPAGDARCTGGRGGKNNAPGSFFNPDLGYCVPPDGIEPEG